MKLTLLLLLVAVLIITAVVFVMKLKRVTVYYPSPVKPQEDFYDGDYVSLCECIERVRNLYQAAQVTRAIYSFQTKYRKHINSTSLNFDINQLFIRLKNQKELIEEGKVLLPMV